MAENLNSGAILRDKLGNVANGLFTKIDSTVQNLGRSRASETDPQKFKVIHRGGALVREGKDSDSPQIHRLAHGELATVVEVCGRRVRIISPLDGWVSTETKDGTQIMRPCRLTGPAASNEAFENSFERKFNRLKAQKGGASTGFDPRAERQDSYSPTRRSPSPVRQRSSDSERSDRGYGGRGGRNRRSNSPRARKESPRARKESPRARKEEAPAQPQVVPKLAAPGSFGGPAVLAPPPSGNTGSGSTQVDFLSADISAAPVPKPPGGGGGDGGTDLLSINETPRPAPPAGPQSFDPFAASPSQVTPQSAPAPAQQTAQWDLLGGAAQSPQAFGAVGGVPQQAVASGMSMGGAPFGCGGFGGCGGQMAGQPIMGQQQHMSQPAAMGMGHMMGQQPAMGMGMGMGMMQQQQPTGMGFMGAGGMGAMCPGGGYGGAAGANFACGAQGCGAAAMGGYPGGCGGCGGCGGGGACGASFPGYQQPAQPSRAGQAGQHAQTDDLMTKAMEGVAQMSFEKRMASQPASQMAPGVPMSMMQQRR